MRDTRFILKSALMLAAIAMLFVLGGCPKHENFPTQLSLVEAPAPTDFVITSLGLSSSGSYDYDLSWTVSDPTHVDHYRLYLLGVSPTPELLDETPLNSLPISLPANASGLQFGVSTVSTGFVESALTSATVPDTVATN
jgi:hypothetical protein